MYISQVNNIQFKGITKFLSCNSEGKQRRLSEYPFGTASFGETRGLSDFIKKHSYPNASIEETIGKLHDNPTHRVYVADPNEIVDDLIKISHDYIVYDCEPVFPDLGRTYFDSPDSLEKGFRDVKSYFERLEHSGSRNKNYNIDQRMLRFADFCLRIIDENKDLIEQKASLERKISARKELVKRTEESVTLYKQELERKKRILENHNKKLGIKTDRLNSLINKSNKQKDSFELKEKIEKYQKDIEKIKSKIKAYEASIEEMENYLAEAPRKTEQCMSELLYFMQELKAVKNALMPSYKKLCNLYAKQGIKVNLRA